ncbi:uncharacterized [Tachysurus ichikawai]
MTEHVPVWVPLGPAAILLNIDIVRRLHLPLYQAAHEEELPTVKLATDENTFCVRKKAAATNLPSTSVEYIEEVQTSNCYKGSGVVYELLCMISVPRSPQYLNDFSTGIDNKITRTFWFAENGGGLVVLGDGQRKHFALGLYMRKKRV